MPALFPPEVQSRAHKHGPRHLASSLFLIALIAGRPLSAQSADSASMNTSGHAEAASTTSVPSRPSSASASTSGNSDRSPGPDYADVVSKRMHSSENLGEGIDPRHSYGIRAGFLLPQNDLKLTTGSLPQITIGAHSEFLIHGIHQVRPAAEWWYFRQGHQSSVDGARSQQIDTSLRGLVFGGEYLYRIGGPDKRFSAGGGLYLIRWSVDSTDAITLPGGTAKFSGASSWFRLGDGLSTTYRFSHRLELEGRWVHSHYGFERIPVNVAIIGAGWRL